MAYEAIKPIQPGRSRPIPLETAHGHPLFNPDHRLPQGVIVHSPRQWFDSERLFCGADQRLTIWIDRGGRGFSFCFHGQVHRGFTSQHQQKRSVLQTLLAVAIPGLEPQEPHHLRGTWCPLDWCTGFEHRSWVGDARRYCATVPWRFAGLPILWVLCKCHERKIGKNWRG